MDVKTQFDILHVSQYENRLSEVIVCSSLATNFMFIVSKKKIFMFDLALEMKTVNYTT